MKVDCNRCGVKILQTTYDKNKGLCMPCKRGYRDSIIETTQRIVDDDSAEYEEVKLYAELTEKILRISTDDLNTNISQLEECIAALERASDALVAPRKKWWSRFRPDTGINWLEGVGIANCAAKITDYLEDKDEIEFQDRSARVWASVVLAVCSHYHHMVGPAMVANIKIAKKKGDIERVKEICHAVKQDFQLILQRYEALSEKPDNEEEDYISLKSLEFAADQSIVLGHEVGLSNELRNRLRFIWSLPARKLP